MASGNSAMELVGGAGWSRGLKNMLRGELSRWFGTRLWWSQILVWAAAINLIFLMAAIGAPRDDAGMPGGITMIFHVFMGIAGPIGVSVMMQTAIVGEKRAGTAAWVLSKPISRSAFVLTKLISNAAGVAVTMVLAQGLIAYLIAGLVLQQWLPPLGMLAALGVHMVNLLFYMTLALMLGTIFDQVAPVVGIPLAFLFTQNFTGAISPQLLAAMPYSLAIPPNNSAQLSLTMALGSGQPLPTLLPLFTTLGACVVFTILALLIFNRQEL